jgi:hypothetical protein
MQAAASMWRFGTAQSPRPLLSPRPRHVSCPAIAPAKGDNHLATQVPPVFDYVDNCEAGVRPGAGAAGELSKLTEELQGLMSELEANPVAQWQPTADGNYVLSVSAPPPPPPCAPSRPIAVPRRAAHRMVCLARPAGRPRRGAPARAAGGWLAALAARPPACRAPRCA